MKLEQIEKLENSLVVFNAQSYYNNIYILQRKMNEMIETINKLIEDRKDHRI